MKDILIYCIIIQLLSLENILCWQIGGVHIQPSKPLPKDLQDFLDSATQGAILVSFGSGIYMHGLVFKGTLAQDFPRSLPFRNIPGLSLAQVHARF